MMRRFVDRVLNIPQMHCQSQSNRWVLRCRANARGESVAVWKAAGTDPDVWAGNSKTPHPQCCRRPCHKQFYRLHRCSACRSRRRSTSTGLCESTLRRCWTKWPGALLRTSRSWSSSMDWTIWRCPRPMPRVFRGCPPSGRTMSTPSLPLTPTMDCRCAAFTTTSDTVSATRYLPSSLFYWDHSMGP